MPCPKRVIPNPYTCTIMRCNRLFEDSTAFMEHIKSKHVDGLLPRPSYLCLWDGCPERGNHTLYETPKLEEHYRHHLDEAYGHRGDHVFVSEAGAAGKISPRKVAVEGPAPLKTVDGDDYFPSPQAAFVSNKGPPASQGLSRSVSGNTKDGQDYNAYAQSPAPAVGQETNGASPAETSGNTSHGYGYIRYNRDAFAPKHVAVVPLPTPPSAPSTTTEDLDNSPYAPTPSTASEEKETTKSARCEWRGCEWRKERDTPRGDSLMDHIIRCHCRAGYHMSRQPGIYEDSEVRCYWGRCNVSKVNLEKYRFKYHMQKHVLMQVNWEGIAPREVIRARQKNAAEERRKRAMRGLMKGGVKGYRGGVYRRGEVD